MGVSTSYIHQSADAEATAADLQNFARGIGCIVTHDEIVVQTDQQQEALTDWMDKNGFGGSLKKVN